MTDSVRMDIRIIKYENYIKKHPQKAYGYYGLGKLNLVTDQCKKAEECFVKALVLDSEHIYSVIGLIEAYIRRGKFYKAVKLYEKYEKQMAQKEIYKRKLCRDISLYYEQHKINMKRRGPFSHFFIAYTSQRINTYYGKHTNNLVALLLLSIFHLSESKKSSPKKVIEEIYNSSVRLDGINDAMRWKLLKKISEGNNEIYQSDEIAALFSQIPSKDCDEKYLNKIFKAILKQRDIQKLNSILKSYEEIYKKLSPSNLWTYVFLCKEMDMLDLTVYHCCSRLLAVGWIDKMVAETIVRLKELKVVNNTNKEEEVLKLYGY